jgi:hypothetical protein
VETMSYLRRSIKYAADKNEERSEIRTVAVRASQIILRISYSNKLKGN